MLFFSFFKPSSNATAVPPHRLQRKPLAEAPRHGEKFSAGTPTSSSASAPHSDDTAATPPNPMRQNAGPILALAGFKRVISVFKYQEFMPDPSDPDTLDQSKPGSDPKQQRSLHPATSALRRKHLYPAQSPLVKNDITDDIMQCTF